MAAAQQYETITMPAGGLGSFFTSNLDEIDDNILMFGQAQGINSMKEVADRMAQYGRNGDNFVVHASEKEVMVPQEVAENNPELVGQIKEAIAAEGADPEAYVVGSDRNSINPITGQREFFLKKLVKGIKKVFKKAAKIIVPLAINYFLPGVGAALGTAGTAALGAGIGGLIQGESLGDALKSAATAGVLVGVGQGVYKGFQAMGEGGAGFRAGFSEGFTSSMPAAYRQSVGNVVDRLTGVAPSGQAGEATTPLNRYQLAQKEIQLAKDAGMTLSEKDALAQVASATAPAKSGSFLGTAAKYGLPALLAAGAGGMFDPIPAGEIDLSEFGVDTTDTSETRLAENRDKYSVGVPDTASPGYIAPTQAIYSGQPLTTAAYLPSQGTYNPIVPSGVYASLTPTGGGTNTGTIVPSSGGAGTYVPPAPVSIPGYNPSVTGMRPAPLYGVDAQGNPIYTPYQEPIMPANYVPPQEVQMAAAGGPMTMNRQGQREMTMGDFPRRTGQIQGPGTETSDDIPAMLSDGEFVMTARAVRGAGGGDRQQGFKKMYDIMRAFEGGAVT